MNVLFTANAWDDYQHWTTTDKAIVARINRLITDARRTPFSGIGKPEALKHQLAGYWSRRITDEHRLVYTIDGDNLVVIAARYHY